MTLDEVVARGGKEKILHRLDRVRDYAECGLNESTLLINVSAKARNTRYLLSEVQFQFLFKYLDLFLTENLE